MEFRSPEGFNRKNPLHEKIEKIVKGGTPQEVIKKLEGLIEENRDNPSNVELLLETIQRIKYNDPGETQLPGK